MPTISVAPDEVLIVRSSGPDAWGTVAQPGTLAHWHVGSASPLNLGAGLYEVSEGLICTKQNRAVAALTQHLPRATEIITAQRIITAAVGRHKAMALGDKAKYFAERMASVPKRIEATFDALLLEVDEMEAMSTQAVATATDVVRTTKESVRGVVDVMNQLTNGEPVSGN